MRTLVALALLLVVAAPALGQIVPEGELDVYDANYDLVGRFIASGAAGHLVAIRTNDGEGVFIRVNQFGMNGRWKGAQAYFATSNCTGPAFAAMNQVFDANLPSEQLWFYSAWADGLFRYGASEQLVTLQSYLQEDGSCFAPPAPMSQMMLPGERVGTLSTAFPFHVAEVPPIAPFLPPGVWVGLAVGMGAIGGQYLGAGRGGSHS